MTTKIETDEEYHAGPGVSKSGLWTLWTKTPYHYRNVIKEQKDHFDFGKAAHMAILEPERMEQDLLRGPDDRRGNKWKEAQDFAAFSNKLLLTAGQYDEALVLRDLADTIPELHLMRGGETIVETSAYHNDEEHGVLVKTRPDMYSVPHKIICDIKTAANAAPYAFAKSVAEYGYHVQEALYSDVWQKGSGYDVEAFFFLVLEKCEPPTLAIYELDAPAVAEGHAIYRAALARYAECVTRDEWPSYPAGVQRIGLPSRWYYKLTTPPEE